MTNTNATLNTSTAEKLIDMGCREWQKGDHHRIYFNWHTDEVLAEFFGLVINRYKTGNISSAYLNGEKISNSEARRIIGTNPYYDVNADRFVGINI